MPCLWKKFNLTSLELNKNQKHPSITRLHFHLFLRIKMHWCDAKVCKAGDGETLRSSAHHLQRHQQLMVSRAIKLWVIARLNPPAPKVLGRDRPDGTRKRLQVYPGGEGGPIFRPKPPVFDRSWRSPSKNTVKNSTEDTCSWTRPSKIGKRKVKKPVFFNFLTSIFWFATSFFAVPQVAWPGGGFLSFWTRFGLIFVVLW